MRSIGAKLGIVPVKQMSLSVLIAVCLTLGVLTGVAVAIVGPYMGTGYFHKSTLYHYYTNTTTGCCYATPNANARAEWNTTHLNVISSTGAWDVATSVRDWGASWAGYGYVCSYNRGCDSQAAWDDQYSYCVARINNPKTAGYSNANKQALITHELGHCWSLWHNQRGTSIMGPGGPIVPDAEDKANVNRRY